MFISRARAGPSSTKPGNRLITLTCRKNGRPRPARRQKPQNSFHHGHGIALLNPTARQRCERGEVTRFMARLDLLRRLVHRATVLDGTKEGTSKSVRRAD